MKSLFIELMKRWPFVWRKSLEKQNAYHEALVKELLKEYKMDLEIERAEIKKVLPGLIEVQLVKAQQKVGIIHHLHLAFNECTIRRCLRKNNGYIIGQIGKDVAERTMKSLFLLRSTEK